MRGWLYYVGTLGWGLGWLPLAAAVGGALVALRRDWRRALLLIAFPLFLYLYLGGQGRFFGRWLLPAYPMLCVLAGYGIVALASAITQRAAAARRRVVAALAALACAQGCARERPRRHGARPHRHARAGAALDRRATCPPARRVVVEPFVPESWRDALERPVYPVERPVPGVREAPARAPARPLPRGAATAGSSSAATRRTAA